MVVTSEAVVLLSHADILCCRIMNANRATEFIELSHLVQPCHSAVLCYIRQTMPMSDPPDIGRWTKTVA